jgi:hypothetical protein
MSAKEGRTPVSGASSAEEIGEYWDTHSLADHWEEGHDVALDVQLVRRHRVTLEAGLYAKIAKEARRRGLKPETLVNLWLAAHIPDNPGSSEPNKPLPRTGSASG